MRRQQERDVRDVLRNAARRAEVAAELHRRLLIGLAHDHTRNVQARTEKVAQEGAARDGGAP